jgi:3-oxoadipate enol-lactonase/4-carboxymuconolactone decarboxylase
VRVKFNQAEEIMGDVIANGISIHYEVKGKGEEKLIFIHGGFNSSKVWGKVMGLMPEGLECFALDTRGCGDSEKPKEGYSFAMLSQGVASFMDALDIDRANIIGHCFGGNIAIYFAANFPEKVNRVVLVDTVARKSTISALMTSEGIKGLMESEQVKGLLTGEAISVESFTWGMISRLIDFMVYDPAKLTLSDAAAFLDGFLKADMSGGTQSLSSLISADLEAELKKIKRPLLVIHGAEDKLYPPEEGRFIAESVPSGKLAIIERSGHFPLIEQPEEFVKALVAFLGC